MLGSLPSHLARVLFIKLSTSELAPVLFVCLFYGSYCQSRANEYLSGVLLGLCQSPPSFVLCLQRVRADSLAADGRTDGQTDEEYSPQ